MIPLVFVHGFMGGSDQWIAQAPLEKSRPVVCVDLPGFGRKAHLDPVNSIEGFAQAVLSELSEQGVDRFDLLGHSMGGMIVQDMVRLSPARINRLVLYGTGASGVLPGRFETIETSMQRAQGDGASATARRISATWFLQEDRADAYPPCAAIAEKASLDAILAGLEAMRDWSGQSHLEQITHPTLVVWGDHDRTYAWAQVEQLWNRIPTSNLAVIPGCAHAVHAEAPAIFNQIIERTLPPQSSA